MGMHSTNFKLLPHVQFVSIVFVLRLNSLRFPLAYFIRKPLFHILCYNLFSMSTLYDKSSLLINRATSYVITLDF